MSEQQSQAFCKSCKAKLDKDLSAERETMCSRGGNYVIYVNFYAIHCAKYSKSHLEAA